MDNPTSDVAASARDWPNIAWSLTGTMLGLASFFIILALVLVNLSEPATPVAEGQLSPIEKIRQLRADDQRQLTTYELIDREKGTWRIPIDVAIEKLLAE